MFTILIKVWFADIFSAFCGLKLCHFSQSKNDWNDKILATFKGFICQQKLIKKEKWAVPKTHQQHADMLSSSGLVQQWTLQCEEPDQLSLLWRPAGESIVSSQMIIDSVSSLSIVHRAYLHTRSRLHIDFCGVWSRDWVKQSRLMCHRWQQGEAINSYGKALWKSNAHWWCLVWLIS